MPVLARVVRAGGAVAAGGGSEVGECLKVLTGLLVVRGHLSLVRDVLECRLELNFD